MVLSCIDCASLAIEGEKKHTKNLLESLGIKQLLKNDAKPFLLTSRVTFGPH